MYLALATLVFATPLAGPVGVREARSAAVAYLSGLESLPYVAVGRVVAMAPNGCEIRFEVRAFLSGSGGPSDATLKPHCETFLSDAEMQQRWGVTRFRFEIGRDYVITPATRHRADYPYVNALAPVLAQAGIVLSHAEERELVAATIEFRQGEPAEVGQKAVELLRSPQQLRRWVGLRFVALPPNRSRFAATPQLIELMLQEVSDGHSRSYAPLVESQLRAWAEGEGHVSTDAKQRAKDRLLAARQLVKRVEVELRQEAESRRVR